MRFEKGRTLIVDDPNEGGVEFGDVFVPNGRKLLITSIVIDTEEGVEIVATIIGSPIPYGKLQPVLIREVSWHEESFDSLKDMWDHLLVSYKAE